MSLHPHIIILTSKLFSFLLALVGFGLLITVHELGHFLFCKLFSVHTPTFSIGMGPTLYSKKIGKTNFQLAAIPLGGYVEIAGYGEMGQGKQEEAESTAPDSFSQKPYWQKALIILGGIIFNILFAYFVIFGIMITIGQPQQKVQVFINQIIENSAAEKYGLQQNDQILSINNQKIVEDPSQIMQQIQNILEKEIAEKPNQEIIIKVKRDGVEKNIPLTIGTKKENNKIKGFIGVEWKFNMLTTGYKKYGFLEAAKKTTLFIYNLTRDMLIGIKQLIKEKTLKGAGGPVMIIAKSFEVAQEGFVALLIFLALISINLAIINLLPFGVLDGGQLVFVSLEAIIRRPIPYVIKFTINLASWIILLGLILYLSMKDIFSVFKIKWHPK